MSVGSVCVRIYAVNWLLKVAAGMQTPQTAPNVRQTAQVAVEIKLWCIGLELDEISNELLQVSAGALVYAATIAKGPPNDPYLASFVVVSRAVEMEGSPDRSSEG
ncbi:hypothetical protein BO71DRAFT_488654 [Aspergillus ellipticus CBS 707.79]|uniref:Uncharacterized protein n=1 Tax=Aspergillus ellipticus CBS 707.79 TaxID=1448320 RepID=A0A319CTD4_9EURO|nr:hypothetical protein BO71DRAFT_488654 [Aspergillus ellipticus CBS 707.79]